MVKELYALCMNQTQIEEYGLQPLVDIHATLGGWPCVEGDNWNPNSTWNWRDGTRDLLHAGFGHAYLFVISIDTDMRNSSRKRIVVCKLNKNEFDLRSVDIFTLLLNLFLNSHKPTV